MRRLWLGVLVAAACSYKPALGPGDGTEQPPDGDDPVGDGPRDADPDSPPPDARDCSAITPPAGCTAVTFACAGSPSCFVLCTNARNYGAAKLNCAPGTLAITNEEIENTCVRNFVAGMSGFSNNVWIGLEQRNTPQLPLDNWFWIDNTPATLDGWGNNPDQPDDANGSENGAEDCGNLEPAVGFAWNDDGCGDSRAYLCELP